jgi:hypothetical protein
MLLQFEFYSVPPDGSLKHCEKSKHAVRTAGILLRPADLGRCPACCSFDCDDFFEALDAEGGEGRHALFAHAIDPKAAIFGIHVDLEVPQPLLVLAELVGDVFEREHV